MNFGLYRLEGHEPVPCTMDEYLNTVDEDRRVAITPIGDGHDLTVSTVFLGIDFSAIPQLFETMVFGHSRVIEDNLCFRCATWDEAIKQHFSVVDQINQLLGKKELNENTET